MVVVLTFSLFKFEQALNKFHFFLTILRMRVSDSPHTYNFLTSESAITPLLVKWKISFNYFWLLGNIFSKLAFIRKSKKWECWLIIIYWFSSIMKTSSIYKVWCMQMSITNVILGEKTLTFDGCFRLWVVDRCLWTSSIFLFVLVLEETGRHVERLSCVFLSFEVLVVARRLQTSNVRVLRVLGGRLNCEFISWVSQSSCW